MHDAHIETENCSRSRVWHSLWHKGGRGEGFGATRDGFFGGACGAGADAAQPVAEAEAGVGCGCGLGCGACIEVK